MAYSNGISIGFDTFDRGIDYDGAVYACNCSADSLSSKGLSSTLSMTDDCTSTYANTIVNKYDDLQDQINILKEQISKVGHSSVNTAAAFRNIYNRLSNVKTSLRSQLQTITEWQTI